MAPKQPLPPLPNDQAVAELSDQYFQSTNLWNETFVTGPLAYAYQNSYVLQGTWLLLEPDQVTDWSGFLPTGFCESGSCVADCQNVDILFNGNLFPSPYSTCMQFANISRSLDNTALWNQSDIVRLMSLGLDEKSAPNFANIATQVTACLTDGCTQNPSASSCQQICDTASLLVNDTTPSFLGIANCMAQVCAQDVSFADFDLAGIGVTASYFLQVLISTLGIIYLLFMNWHCASKSIGSESRERRQDRKDEFITSLVEFHKAQCYFVVAVQVAALVTMGNGVDNTASNMAVIPITAAIGIQAPIFVYLAIVKYGRQSSYLLCLTLVAWTLATSGTWTAYKIANDDLLTDYSTQNPIMTCGVNNAIAPFCANLNYGTYMESDALLWLVKKWYYFWFPIWGISIPILLSMVVQWLQETRFPRLQGYADFFNPFLGRIEATRWFQTIWHRPWRVYTTYIAPDSTEHRCLYFSVLAVPAGSLRVELYQVAYVWFLNPEDAHNWSFGQIVAVLSWAAPVGEFLNLSINGIINGSNFRFARSLTVARVRSRSKHTQVVDKTHHKDPKHDQTRLLKPDDEAHSALKWSQSTMRSLTGMAGYKSYQGLDTHDPDQTSLR